MEESNARAAEKRVLSYLRKQAKGADMAMLTNACPDVSEKALVIIVNSLTAKQLVDIVHFGKVLAFKARDTDDVQKMAGLDQNDRIIYNIIRGAGNKGIWIKDIKTKSNMHVQLVSASIKSLEKRALIKSTKSVNNPTKKLYILAHLEPSLDLTGGSWYTDQEFDLEFIDALARQCYKFIYQKEGEGDSDAIRDNGYEGYPTPNDILGFIRKTGITNVELTVADIRQLLERLVYDGLVSKRQKAGSERFGDQAYAPTKTTSVPKPKKRKRKIKELEDESDAEIIGEIDSDEGMMMIEEAVEDEDMWMYVARRREVKDVEKSGEKSMGTGCAMPCGKCPVFAFCQVGGPVNPENCEYLDEWLGGF